MITTLSLWAFANYMVKEACSPYSDRKPRQKRNKDPNIPYKDDIPNIPYKDNSPNSPYKDNIPNILK